MFLDNNGLSNNLHNNPFLPGFSSSQADSWWLEHVEPDDVVIADIGGQALDIFLHGPESARKNGILKTFTHTSIPIHPCTLLKKKKKKKKEEEEEEEKKKKWKKPQLTKHNAFVYWSSSCPVWS